MGDVPVTFRSCHMWWHIAAYRGDARRRAAPHPVWTQLNTDYRIA